MLTDLAIRNYAIVDQLEIEMRSGMTCVTGETGAGKSIMLDALGLCLGDRADSRTVRSGCDKTLSGSNQVSCMTCTVMGSLHVLLQDKPAQ